MLFSVPFAGRIFFMLFFLFLNIFPIVSLGGKKKKRKLLVGKINEYLIFHNSQNVLQYQLPRFVKEQEFLA